MIRLLPAVVAAFAVLPARAAAQSDSVPSLEPGDPAIDGRLVQAHDARWSAAQWQNGAWLPVGTFERRVRAVMHTADEPAWLLDWHVEMPNRSALDVLYLDRETLTPFVRYVTSPGGMWVQYPTDRRALATLVRRAGTPTIVDTTWSGPRFAGGMLDLILGLAQWDAPRSLRFPLVALGATTLEAALGATALVRAEGAEPFALPDGQSVDARVLFMKDHNGSTQRLWVTSRPPYLLRRHVLNEAGEAVFRWELAGVDLVAGH